MSASRCESTRRTLHQQVVQQMTVVSALFGGFSFTNLTLMPSEGDPTFISLLNLALAGIAACLLVGSAFLGGIFSLIATTRDVEEMLERERAIFGPWGAMVTVGVVTFFVNVGVLAFRSSAWVGVLVLLAALTVLSFAIFTCWRLIGLTASAPTTDAAAEPG